ncbi:flavin reductase family protein [Rhodococcus koreensis]
MPPIDPVEFRRVLGHWPTGVAVIAAMSADGPVGMSCNSFTSVSLDPPLIGFFPALTSTTWPVLRSAGRFCVNVLGDDHEQLSRSFARKYADRFSGVAWREGPCGPMIDGAAAWIGCELHAELLTGDHTLALGAVVEFDAEAEILPLVFHRGTYGRLSG